MYEAHKTAITGGRMHQPTRLPQPWRTSSQKPYKSNSAASDGDLTWLDLRIIRAMQSSARPRHDG